MNWTPDDRDIPISIPKNLEDLEKIDPHTLHAMTKQEIKDRLRDIAQAAATNCKTQIPDCSYDTCVLVVSTVLKKVGSDIGEGVGRSMAAESQTWAEIGCKSVFLTPED